MHYEKLSHFSTVFQSLAIFETNRKTCNFHVMPKQPRPLERLGSLPDQHSVAQLHCLAQATTPKFE